MPDEAKQDYLRVCNDHNIPFTDFMAGWCSRCFQKECTRSLHGKSRFESRANTWEDRLFKNPLKLDPKDDRYKDITAKRFLNIAPGSPGASSAWLDPREVEVTKTISIPTPSTPTPGPGMFRPPPPDPEGAPPDSGAAPPALAPPPEVKPAPTPVIPPVLTNTPNRPRQMIGGAEQKAPQPVLDPWQPKQALKPDDKLIQPGARIKFGS